MVSANYPSMELVNSGSEADVPGVMLAVVVGSGVELSCRCRPPEPCTTRRGVQLPRASPETVAAQGPAVLPCQDMDWKRVTSLPRCQGTGRLANQAAPEKTAVRTFFFESLCRHHCSLHVIQGTRFGGTMLL